jgi:hypothetical protein
MNRAWRILFYVLAIVLLGGIASAYEFFVGFPRTFEGRRVHRVTVWDAEHRFEPERMYYAYTGADGKEAKHGVFKNFQDGRLVQQAIYRDGKIDGALTYWNLLGAKTQEIYYHAGTPYGWANFANGKLLNMRQEVAQDGRTVAVKSFNGDHYILEFRCGELMNVAIDPRSGEISPVANPQQRECGQSQASVVDRP